MEITQLTLGMMQSHCYIAYKQNQAIVIDPGDESEIIINQLKELKVLPVAILLTHGHFDHIGAVDALVNLYHIPVYLHQDDEKMVYDSQLNLSYFNSPFILKSKTFNYPEQLNLIGYQFDIIHTPGHSKGSVIIKCDHEHIMFSGDVVFKDSIGRCDFPESDYSKMQESLSKVSQIDDDYIIYPGHGQTTTLLEEKIHNPYLSSI